jgi:nucleoside-diphosphate-sugar epimerase
VTRREHRAAWLREQGFSPIVADVTDPRTLGNLPQAETVLHAIGYDRHSGRSIADVYVNGLRAVLETLPPPTKHLIYISSSGVFGQSDGSWVDESSTCVPTSPGGQACLAAEQLLSQHGTGAVRVVLRLAGIYGPGRIPRRRDLEQNRPIPAPETGYLNLIHVDDAVEVILAASQVRSPPCLYVVSDGCPVTRRGYFRELARLLGAAPPRFELPPADSPVALRAASNKRIRNQRMLKELRITLKYPDYRAGLAASIAADV